MKTFLILILTGFCLFCGILVVESGLFANSICQRGCILLQQPAADENISINDIEEEVPRLEPAVASGFNASAAELKTVKIGAKDPVTENANAGFKFQLELTSKGAAIEKATFSNGLDEQGKQTGFNDRDPDNPSPFVLLSPAGDELSMANREFVFVEEGLQLRLNNLYWKSYDVEIAADGSQTARFETVITESSTEQPVIKVTKTYSVKPDSYDVHCSVTVENLTSVKKKTRFNMAGPIGVQREAARMDARKVVGAFTDSEGEVVSMLRDIKKLQKAKTVEDTRLQNNSNPFLWAAVTNKYFAAILVPQLESVDSSKTW
ncbi:MAG: YidC/Oxa1 family insertase periplasmic-domain containing protein, partial [Planctomycetota bacterium]